MTLLADAARIGGRLQRRGAAPWGILTIFFGLLIYSHSSGGTPIDQPPATATANPSSTRPSGGTSDPYGGDTHLSCQVTGFFHTQEIDGRWWLCDPAGYVFWMTGVGAVSIHPASGVNDLGLDYVKIVTSKYGDSNVHWGPQQNRRLLSWGFNSVAEDSDSWVMPWAKCGGSPGCDWPHGEQPVKLPALGEMLISNYAAVNLHDHVDQAVKDMLYGLNDHYTAWRESLVDFFDPRYQRWLDGYFGPRDQKVADNRWLIGEALDDSDWLWGAGATPDFHSVPAGHTNADIGYMVVITSPVQAFNPNPVQRHAPQFYMDDTTVYSKAAALNPTAACSISNPCSLRDYLWQKYHGSVGALNRAWGSDYTTFDSSGVRVRDEIVAVADGRSKAFSHRLARTPVSPESVMVKLDGKPVAGDCPWFAGCVSKLPASTGVIEGSKGTVEVGERPWLGEVKAKSCDCGVPAQNISIVIAYHMKGGDYSFESREVGVDTKSGEVAVVPSPASHPRATGYDVYAAAAPFPSPWSDLLGKQVLQATNVPFGTDWVEPPTGIVATGDRPPLPPTQINYSNGETRIAFSSPPAAGKRITVDYVSNGWVYGTGLMDEDGRHKWIGTNPYCLRPATACDGKDLPLPNANAAVAADLDGWIQQFAAKYFQIARTEWKKYAPHNLYLGLDTIGSWGVPARKEILEGAQPYVDAVFTSWTPNHDALQYMTKSLKGVPIINFLTLQSNRDSALWRHARSGDIPTQQQRGQAYVNVIQAMLQDKGYYDDHPFIGSVWWGLTDFLNEKTNWGMVSLQDNPYDGKSGAVARGADPWGYPTGGEERDYGDFIDSAKQANQLWHSFAAGTTK